jgi:uncharacterized protein YegP (UPF0339 family)
MTSYYTSVATGVFQVYRDTAGQYRWRLRAANGEIVAQGEGYTSRAGAHAGVEAVKRLAPGARTEDL